MKMIIDFLKKRPLLTAAIGVAFVILSIRALGPRMTNDLEAGVFRLAFAFSGMCFLFLISGSKAFDRSCGTTGYVCKVLWPTLILPAVGFVGALVGEIRNGTPLRPDFVSGILIIAFEYMAVGLVEEVSARGLITDGLLYRFRDNKNIFVIIAIVDVIVFGAAHIIGSRLDTPTAVLQGLLKTLSSGIGALAYLFLYWKTRNLWGIAIMHGALDFIASIPEALFRQGVKDTTASYVSADAEVAAAGMIIMGVDLLINLVIVIWIWKKHMKDVDFEEIRRTW